MTHGRVNALFAAGHITPEEASDIIRTQVERDVWKKICGLWRCGAIAMLVGICILCVITELRTP